MFFVALTQFETVLARFWRFDKTSTGHRPTDIFFVCVIDRPPSSTFFPDAAERNRTVFAFFAVLGVFTVFATQFPVHCQSCVHVHSTMQIWYIQIYISVSIIPHLAICKSTFTFQQLSMQPTKCMPLYYNFNAHTIYSNIPCGDKR